MFYQKVNWGGVGFCKILVKIVQYEKKEYQANKKKYFARTTRTRKVLSVREEANQERIQVTNRN